MHIEPGFLEFAQLVPEGIDTDQVSTFTGEIPRFDSMEEVVVQKA